MPPKKQQTIKQLFCAESLAKKPRLDNQTNYDRDESRSIKPEWFNLYNWLSHDKEKNVFLCTLCIKEKKTNVFTSGKDASKPKKDDFVKHAAGKDHCAARQAKPQRTGIEIATKTAYQRVERAIISLMRSIYFQAKKNIANMVLSDLVELQVENGCEELRILMKLESQPLYTHHASADDFRDSMAKVVEDGYLPEVINAKYFALMMDESTDVAIQQTLMVYVRIVDDDGRVRTHFLSTVRLDAADAAGIYKAAYDVMTSKGFDQQRLIALATDGASVMTGVKTGVTTRFKADNPFLFATHCLAHRLALASSQAADKVKYLVKYQSVVNVIYKYFEQSPKNTRLFNLVKGTLLGIEIVNLLPHSSRLLAHAGFLFLVQSMLLQSMPIIC